MTAWHLFLDDERFPPDDGRERVVARTSVEAIEVVADKGMPSSISFDHDLGGDDTAIAFVAWLTERVLDGALSFPEDFSYHVHSQNPIGAANIRGRMDGILEHVRTPAPHP